DTVAACTSAGACSGSFTLVFWAAWALSVGVACEALACAAATSPAVGAVSGVSGVAWAMADKLSIPRTPRRSRTPRADGGGDRVLSLLLAQDRERPAHPVAEAGHAAPLRDARAFQQRHDLVALRVEHGVESLAVDGARAERHDDRGEVKRDADHGGHGE